MTLDDETLRAFLRELAPIQSLGADLQSVSIAPDRGGRGTPDADGKRVGQIDRGDVTKGRVAHARLSQCRSREAFAWLVEVAHCDWTLDALALHLAASHGPIEARESLSAAIVAGVEASREREKAKTLEGQCRAAHGPLSAATIKAAMERAKADGRVASAEAKAVVARDALVAWGRAVVVGAWREWEAT